jgi:hypothetical protein
MQERERIVDCATPAEAARLRDELRDPAGVADARKRVRLSDFSISWLSGKRKEIKAATLDRYTRTLAHHVLPQLGDYYVDALTHNDSYCDEDPNALTAEQLAAFLTRRSASRRAAGTRCWQRWPSPACASAK